MKSFLLYSDEITTVKSNLQPIVTQAPIQKVDLNPKLLANVKLEAPEMPEDLKLKQEVVEKAPDIKLPPYNTHIKITDAWKMANDWIQPRELYPDPEINNQVSGYVDQIQNFMVKARIKNADVLSKGTQMKMLLYLEGKLLKNICRNLKLLKKFLGNQKVVFKPKRFERDDIIPGEVWDGFDRHNAEVAGFHLDKLLNFRRAPIVVGRMLNMMEEIEPVASERLRKTLRTITIKNGTEKSVCFFGECYYCKEADLACPNQEGLLEGSLTYWMEKDGFTFGKLRHPYQRTYRIDKKAAWETNEKYCETRVKKTNPYNKGPRLLDIMDGSVFDYLINNGDRHHYEVFTEYGANAMMLMLDNAKAFGDPSQRDASVLAPLRQCCLLRDSTMSKLESLRGVLSGKLNESMKNDPIFPVLTDAHLKAMDARLEDIFAVIEDCQKDQLLSAW